MDHLLCRKTECKLPDLPPDELSDKFASFFIEKIVAIRRNLSSCVYLPPSVVYSVVSSFLESDLVEFDSVPQPDIEELIKLSSSKSCASDPLPSWMVKQCLPVLLPFITNIVNLCDVYCAQPV